MKHEITKETPEQFTWTVKQWKLTQAERDEVNEKDWCVQNEYCDVKNKPTVENVQWGLDNGKYKETANALAYNPEEVFQMGNYFDASDNFSHTEDFYSISIGDVLINNQTYDMYFVADWGFENLNKTMAEMTEMTFTKAVDIISAVGDGGLLEGMEYLKSLETSELTKPELQAYNIVYEGMNKLFNGDK